MLGKTIKNVRDKIVISTKFGYKVDEKNKKVSVYGGTEEDSNPAPFVIKDVEQSLKRLGTDYIDVLFLHVGGLRLERALEVREKLEILVRDGKIRTYGWSTYRKDAIEAFSTSKNCGVVQQGLSVLEGDLDILAFYEKNNIASVNRSCLEMVLLTGKFNSNSTFKKDDFRSQVAWHPGFKDGKPTAEWLNTLESIRGILTEGRRTLAQGAFAWLWAKRSCTIPIPGFRTVQQVEDNARAMEKGPLTAKQMTDIENILKKNRT